MSDSGVLEFYFHTKPFPYSPSSWAPAQVLLLSHLSTGPDSHLPRSHHFKLPPVLLSGKLPKAQLGSRHGAFRGPPYAQQMPPRGRGPAYHLAPLMHPPELYGPGCVVPSETSPSPL